MRSGLVWKDFVAIRRRLIAFEIISLSLYLMMWIPLAMIGTEIELVGFVGSICILMYLIISGIYEFEDRDEVWPIIVASPYTREEIIRNRYVFVILCLLCHLFIWRCLGGFIHLVWKVPMNSGSFITCLFVCSCLYGISLMLFTRYGYVKTRNLLMTLYFGIVVLVTFALKGINHSTGKEYAKIVHSFAYYKQQFQSLGFIGSLLVTILVCSCIWYLSYRVSLKLYKSKDF